MLSSISWIWTFIWYTTKGGINGHTRFLFPHTEPYYAKCWQQHANMLIMTTQHADVTGFSGRFINDLRKPQMCTKCRVSSHYTTAQSRLQRWTDPRTKQGQVSQKWMLSKIYLLFWPMLIKLTWLYPINKCVRFEFPATNTTLSHAAQRGAKARRRVVPSATQDAVSNPTSGFGTNRRDWLRWCSDIRCDQAADFLLQVITAAISISIQMVSGPMET